MSATNPISALQIAAMTSTVLDELQAEDPAVLDVRELSTVTNYYVIVSGNSQPHLNALSQELQGQLRDQGQRPYRKSGTPVSGWVVLDYVDVVVHLMTRDAREFYQIEELWNDAPRLDWPVAAE